MYRIPPDYHWKQKVKAYRSRFRKKVPQWVLMLTMADATKLLSSCLVMNYCLPSEVLIAGEVLEGRGSMDSPSQSLGYDCQTRSTS